MRDSHGKRDAKTFSRDLGHGKNLSSTVKRSESQAISASLRGLQRDLGGKNLAAYFDGREGREVAQSTVSRWISEPDRFPAVFVPVLCELDADYRRGHVRRLLASEMIDAEFLRTLDVDKKTKDQIALQQYERFCDLAFGHNRMGEGYA